MTCHELITFLDLYVADGLSPEQRSEFERHLAVCPACQAYLQNYRHVMELARREAEDPLDGTRDDVPEELIAAVLAARRRASRSGD
jgi:anti-sigma factor RsiW